MIFELWQISEYYWYCVLMVLCIIVMVFAAMKIKIISKSVFTIFRVQIIIFKAELPIWSSSFTFKRLFDLEVIELRLFAPINLNLAIGRLGDGLMGQ